MKRITSFLFSAMLAALAALPAAAATWSVNPSNADQIVDATGSWTITLNKNFDNTYNGVQVKGASVNGAAYVENGANGVLDLTTVNDDLAEDGITLVAFDDEKFYNKGIVSTSLTEVYMPDSIQYIGKGLFRDCKKLAKVKISANVVRFHGDGRQFGGCTSLTTVYSSERTVKTGTLALPMCFTEIPEFAFENCPFTCIYAPGVTVVLRGAFAGCSSIKSAEFSPSLKRLFTNKDSSTQTAFINANTEYTSFVDFHPTTFASDFAFVTTTTETFPFINVSRVAMNNGGAMARIGITNHLDFSACKFTTVPNNVFERTAVKQVTLPATVTTINAYAFGWIHTKSKIRFLGDVPTTWGGSGSSAAFYPENGTRGDTANRHQIIVDAENYPNWTNANFVAVADLASSSDSNVKNYFSTSSADYPGEDTLGVTTYGSGDGCYNWLVQYVDHSTVAATWMNDGVQFDSTTVATGTAPTAPDGTPTKDSTAEFDYTFVGWNTDPDATTALDLSQLSLTANTTFYAIYTAATRSYTITWKLDANTDIDTTTVLYGDVPTHADASKASDGTYSYSFDGWSTDGSTVLSSIPAVTGAATYIAVFTQHSVDTTAIVSWFDEDGTTPLDPATTTVEKGAKPTHAEPTKAATVDTAYTFEGWTQVGGDGTVVYTTADLPAASADVSYKAVYSSATRKYTITFMDYDGTTILKTAEIEYNSAATVVEAAKPADPVRAATAEYTYAFSGWTPAFADVRGDATYTAQYTATPNEYTATFVDEDGTTVLKEEATYAYGAPVVKPDDPTKEGYTFAGWTVGGAVVDVTTMPAANTVYAATYTKNTYTITWKNANGATLGTTTVEHGETPAYGGTAPSLSNTSKLGYTFTGWTPEIVAAAEAATYTAAYKVTFLSPMTIALDSAAYDRSQGEATVVTKVGNTDAAATTTAEATAQFKTTSVTGESTVDGTTVTSVFDNFASGRGYEWTITATQTYGAEYSGASESASIKGRTYARAAKSWFGNDDISWNEGAFAPTGASGSGAQVRLRATVTFPTVLPRALPEAGSAVVGITACQPNAGVAPRYYAWNGSQWVKLVGVAPKGGVAVNLLGVVDFARKDGPAVAWYADGFQLTTEDGDWEMPLADGTQLSSFGLVGDLTVGSLSGDYDIGGQGFMLLIR